MKSKNNKEIFESKKLSINNKIGQPNSSINNHEIVDNNINNKTLNLNEIEKNNEFDEKNEMNIENQENNGNIINNNNAINLLNLENINNEKNNENSEILKPSLTYNKSNELNSFFVPIEYVNDIWDSFLEKEKYNNYSYEDIIQKQTDIKEPMRCILIDWLISLQNKFFMKSKTLFLIVNLIDRYLSQKAIIRTRFQLLGVTALFIASKYEEMYMKNIELPLSLDFFCLLGTMYKFDKKEFHLGYFLLEAYLLSLQSCKYKQRQIGLAVCYIILGLRNIQNINPIMKNNNFLKYYSEIYEINFDIWSEYNIIIECAKHIYNFYEKSEQVKYREVYIIFRDIFV